MPSELLCPRPKNCRKVDIKVVGGDDASLTRRVKGIAGSIYICGSLKTTQDLNVPFFSFVCNPLHGRSMVVLRRRYLLVLFALVPSHFSWTL